ncbi:hypothetical protein [Flammeovirga sp. SubArs3]|uniref:hypothetical protein n=1 Tax=Flammeovirga sp. SubArs3 TaxID=2995316 RepID=UPI00248C99BF|nr:hypothetical protein [Flammeovirga sp. SubArs3]
MRTTLFLLLKLILILLVNPAEANIHFSFDQTINTESTFTDAAGIYVDPGVTLTITENVTFNGNLTLQNGASLIVSNGAFVSISVNLNLNNSTLTISQNSIVDVINGQLNLQGYGGNTDKVVIDNAALFVDEIHSQNIGGHEIELNNNSLLLVNDFIQYNQTLTTNTKNGAVVVGNNVQGANVNLDFGDSCGDLDGSFSCDTFERSSADIADISRIIQYGRQEIVAGTDFNTVVDYIQGGGDFEDGYDLPVELVRFEGCIKDNTTHIIWETATEENSDYFILYYSNDKKNWKEVDRVNAAGNSNGLLQYQIIHEIESEVSVHYYKLHQIDFDGREEMFEEIMIRSQYEFAEPSFTIKNASVHLDFLDNTSQKHIEIYDVIGNLVVSRDETESQISIQSINKGKIYILKAMYGRQYYIKKFVILN